MKRLDAVLDKLYEASVVLSYGAPGYRLRTRRWDPAALEVDLAGKVCAITGGNAGIGRAAARALAARGATVILGCRDERRGARAQGEIIRETGNEAVALEVVDVSSLDSTRRFAARLLAAYPRLDVLINNAGVMLHERQLSSDGVEMTFATNVLGGFVLVHELEERLRDSAPARVVHVTSGGMYTARIDVADPLWSAKRYDGVAAYAQTKRAQVILSELWAERFADSGVTSNCMHPGWAGTPGVERSLPTFERLTRPLLRTPEQGADTVVWLAASPEALRHNGKLFLDRTPRRTHVFPWTRESSADRLRLWSLCEELAARAPGHG